MEVVSSTWVTVPSLISPSVAPEQYVLAQPIVDFPYAPRAGLSMRERTSSQCGEELVKYRAPNLGVRILGRAKKKPHISQEMVEIFEQDLLLLGGS